jgi:hypothetical protein
LVPTFGTKPCEKRLSNPKPALKRRRIQELAQSTQQGMQNPDLRLPLLRT